MRAAGAVFPKYAQVHQNCGSHGGVLSFKIEKSRFNEELLKSQPCLQINHIQISLNLKTG
jgi:hypothetical protein